MELIKLILLLAFFVCFVQTASVKNNSDLFGQFSFNATKCREQSDCKSDEYCDKHSSWLSIKRGSEVCFKKIKHGKSCNGHNYQCLSNHCHWFKCAGRQIGKNVDLDGSCNDNEDCRFEQYCKSKKCVNRKKYGLCTSDEQCVSNHCSLFKCKTL